MRHGWRFRPKSRRIQAVPRICHTRYPMLAHLRAETGRMPDAIDLLKTRRSVKPMQLGGPGLSQAEIETLLTVASRVPDHGKLTPWRFIVFEGAARLTAGQMIAEAFRKDHPEATPEQIEFERNRL